MGDFLKREERATVANYVVIVVTLERLEYVNQHPRDTHQPIMVCWRFSSWWAGLMVTLRETGPKSQRPHHELLGQRLHVASQLSPAPQRRLLVQHERELWDTPMVGTEAGECRLGCMDASNQLGHASPTGTILPLSATCQTRHCERENQRKVER